MTDINALRAILTAQKEKGKNGGTQNSSGGDNASYPFWNIPNDSEALVRFLPDADPNNTFFWVKREVIKLPFEGVVGGDYPTNKQVTVTVPCVEMWGDTCPIISATRPWWKDPQLEPLARTYWKKKSYIFQGFVVNSPMVEDNVPENPIRRFVINPSIYEIIEKSLINPDMEDMPTDFIGGRDFKIAKTKKGEYANYTTSSWSFKTRSLDDNERAAIEQYKLWNLSDYQGRRPDADELEAIKAMFQDSVDGKPFDHDSYGKYYRAFAGRGSDDVTAAQPVRSAPVQAQTASFTPSVSTSAPEREEAPAPTPTPSAEPTATEKTDVAAMLARIQSRTKNNG